MRFLIYLTLVVSTSLHAGDIHKWVDENGNIFYGDTPPPETKSESVAVQPAPSNPGTPLPRLSPEQPGSEPSDESRADADALSDGQAQSICEKAQNDLQVIMSSDKIMLQQPDGSSRYLSDEEIAQRRSSSQSQVDLYCR